MDVTGGCRGVILTLFFAGFIGCGTRADLDQTASPADVLRAAGHRLSQTMSERTLTAIATRGDMVVSALNRDERKVLAENCLRFRVNIPVEVDVAVPGESIPFWIDDLNFQPTELTLRTSDTSWKIYRKIYHAGVIGLGVNGIDRTPAAHYAVFVRPLSSSDRVVKRASVELEGDCGPRWKMTEVREGVSSAHDLYKPFDLLPNELIGSTLLQPAHGDRHSALLATGRVWKTRVVSSKRPDQVVIAFGSDPARELVWTWRTAADVTASAVRIAPDSTAPPAVFRVATGESTPLEVRNLINDPVTRRHRVVVDQLEPDTTYRYALGDGSDDGWGPWQTVKTAPDATRGARFLYLGDAQTGLERWGRLLAAAVGQNPGVDCVLLAGDLVDRGNERTNWDHFFLRAASVFERVPLLPCVGNHEYLDMGPRLYRAFFELPRNGPPGIDTDLVYSFECGDACVAVLDSTLAVCDATMARRQAEWLDEVLGKTKATWKLVMFHHPVYPSHPWRDSPAMRTHWVPVFDKHNVDLVLEGHDHAYQRTYPLRGHHRVDAHGGGTIYVIAVSGDKFVEQTPRDYVEVGYSGLSTYQMIEIDARAKRLSYRARTEDGTVVDGFELEKPRMPLVATEAIPSAPTATIAPIRK